MVFGFCGTGTLACAVGTRQSIMLTPLSRAAKMPSIPLSSLSEPAGAGVPGPRRFLRGLGWGARQAGFWPVGIDVPSLANELLWSLDFVAQALLPVLSG